MACSYKRPPSRATSPNGRDQATILVATRAAEKAFGVQADLEMSSAAMAGAGGLVCFDVTEIDCASWGGYSGADDHDSGPPFNPATGIPAGSSMRRDITGGSRPAALDAGDDTDNSEADFELAAPSPKPNAAPDSARPSSRIRRPVHRETYERSRFRSLSGTARDDRTVARVQVALRKKLKSGACRWWDGNGFVARACDRKLWRRADGSTSWTYSLSSRLRRSVGTTTRFYTAYSRATDGAGKTERTFEVGRNANRFEID